MSSNITRIEANGILRSVQTPCSVADFVAGCGYKSTQVVVEHNGNVLARNELAHTMLKDGDRLEVIVPVAGG